MRLWHSMNQKTKAAHSVIFTQKLLFCQKYLLFIISLLNTDFIKCFFDNFNGIHQLLFGNYQRRGKPDGVFMSGFGQQPVLFQCYTNIPCRFSLSGFYFNSIQQPFSANGFN
jgi:hypothetical protein